jgi:hypothetical protein
MASGPRRRAPNGGMPGVHGWRNGMSEQAALPQPLDESARPVRTPDIIVVVQTFNNARTIEQLMKGVVAGLRQYFPGSPGLIVNCDGGSQDGTPSMIEGLAGDCPVHIMDGAPLGAYPTLTTESGMHGGDRGLKDLCAIAEQMPATAYLILDGNLRSLTPEWMDLLGRPVQERGADFVIPLYQRHRYDGTLAHNLLSPLLRALYGKRIRYPSGGARALSGPFAKEVLARLDRDQAMQGCGLDCTLATLALTGDGQIWHAYLGAKAQDGPFGAADLATVLSQAVGCVFHSMEEYESRWEAVKDSVEIPLYGKAEQARASEPVQVVRMVGGFKQGLRDLLPLWDLILPPETLDQILPLGMLDPDEFRFPVELWVQVVYDFALAYHDQVLHRDHLLRSLTPLYLGRTASFVLETKDGAPSDVETAVESIGEAFERMKPYLLERWRWRDE